jgi:hypothetical protein
MAAVIRIATRPLHYGDDRIMRDEIMSMCVEVLRRTGYPEASPESAKNDPEHAAAVLALLKDCRPLPVVQDLIDELEGGVPAVRR